MFFKRKSKIEQQSQPQKPATIQERMTEVYYDSSDYLGFKAKERKDTSKLEEEITTWSPC